ncbi:transforming growth factor-beta-induced protein [Thermophagus xiamenensis]|uniref:Transforming growth factor-beta-induced protein n=2 Tax=Thermophagus xiamenensis TaxID=385682 RepID=A0A1I2BK02_9BACT|nr:transforming growth factor-beta-induced protein [Thermophagus xiamenensis]
MKFSLLIVLSGIFILASCDKNDDNNTEEIPDESNTIVDVASADENFSVLIDALELTDLKDALADENAEYTVFAPTNDAFSDLLTELGYDELEDLPNDDLKEILLYHVLAGKAEANEVENGYYSTLADGPQDGYTLSMYINMDDEMINSRASITATDIMADNGVIHVVDKVILPLSLSGHAAANSAFSVLEEVVEKAGLSETLNNSSLSFTVFAPVDDAFNQLFTNLGFTLDDLSLEDLQPILLYHVVTGFLPSADIESGYVTTLSQIGEQFVSLQVSLGDNIILNGNSNVIIEDVVATNGIIHAIDEVLIPPEVVDLALDNSDFSYLVEALVKVDLVEALRDEGPFTVFAPVNSAFEDLFETLGVNGLNDIDDETLENVLLAHVVSGYFLSSDLSNGSLSTLNSEKSLTINVDNGIVIDGDINVLLADIKGTNGVVHVIDKVIVP